MVVAALVKLFFFFKFLQINENDIEYSSINESVYYSIDVVAM